MTSTDTAFVRQMFADDYARQVYPQMQLEDAATKWIDWNEDNYRDHGYGLWVIETDDGVFVGDCGLTWQNGDSQRVLELGYHVTAAMRGRGYAVEAGRATLVWGFAELEVDAIYSIVSPDNPASQAVAGKVHRQLSEFVRPSGARRLLYSTHRSEWNAADN